jgi:hypothetical protein
MRGWERAHINSQDQTAAGRWRGWLTLAVVLGLMGALLSAAAPIAAQAAGPTWSTVQSPNQPGPAYGGLSGVSCVSASSCVAVGNWTTAPTDADLARHTLAEVWNGSTWKIVPSPDDGTNSLLTAVSCVSASFCVAAGSYADGTLVEQWNGSTWSIVPSASTTGELEAVSCVSDSFCTAVGIGPAGTLVESWNGSTWSTVPSPNPSGGGLLYGVSCTAADSCTAVGHYVTGTGIDGTLVESWNGSTWSIVSSPNSGISGSVLTAVSCISASSCTAAGSNSGNPETTLIESWNGTAWSVVSSPDQGTGGSALSGVSCVSASSCTAVGNYAASAGVLQTLAESWNGSTWSIVSSPNQGSAENNELAAVSCRAASACTAVGSYDYYDVETNAYAHTLAEAWNGSTWSVVTSPSHVSFVDSLNDVSCVSASFCVAVGSYLNGARVVRTLIESWNGSAWSLVTSPNKFTAANVLDSVSCVSATFCVAVGSWSNGSAALVETWNGSTWSVAPAPAGGGASFSTAELLGVSCPSVSFCVADGWEGGPSGNSTLAESWNGSTWSLISIPNPAHNQRLLDVACASASSCFAVGFYQVESEEAPDQTLIESWNGSTWSMVSSPDANTNNNSLTGVTCLSATSCTAVGYSQPAQTLVESWNGTAWSLVSSPNEGTGGNVLSGVSCVSASSCAAVGYSGGGSRTLVESWNGTAWSVLSSPSPGTPSRLAGVSCVSAVSCTAVGYDNNASIDDQYSLIERSS